MSSETGSDVMHGTHIPRGGFPPIQILTPIKIEESMRRKYFSANISKILGDKGKTKQLFLNIPLDEQMSERETKIEHSSIHFDSIKL